jgi:hypothetical protein
MFDIVGTNITIDPTSLVVPEFKKLWDRDKTKDKRNAMNELTFIVFLLNPSRKNPYSNYSEADRKEMLMADYNISKIDPLLQEACDKYKKLTLTRYKRVITAALESTDKLTDYYKNVDTTDSNFSITEYLNSLEKLNKGVKSLRDLEKQLDVDDQDESTKVKGQSEIGEFEL